MHEDEDGPFEVVDADDGCALVDHRTGRRVAEVAERWLAERWADELNAHERLRRRSAAGEGEPPVQR